MIEELNDRGRVDSDSIKVSWTDESMKVSLEYDWASVVDSLSLLSLMFEGSSVLNHERRSSVASRRPRMTVQRTPE